MRFHLLAVLIWLASLSSSGAYEIKWPDADIPVPPMIHAYIVTECHTHKGFSEESVQDCIQAERYGYRAVVTMLIDPVRGEEFANRYRMCRAGLGDLGGRFHRRRADCMACVMQIVWRFEFMQRASIGSNTVIVERQEPCRNCGERAGKSRLRDEGRQM